ncbi:hypothetical protein ACHAQH_000171 [Verticillium albo-atrum]
MVVGLVASLVSTIVHSSKCKSTTKTTDGQASHPQQPSAHDTPCARGCSICAVVPSLATRYERKQERKDRRNAHRMDRRIERGARMGYYSYAPGIVVQPTVSVGGYATMSGQSYGVRYVDAPRQEPVRSSDESQERGLTEGDAPPPYEQGDAHRAADEKIESRQ